jgi:putative transposase
MKGTRFTQEQIIAALNEAAAGAKIPDICRKVGISSHTFYVWRRKYGGMSVSEAAKVRALETENAKLKRLVADLTLDKLALQDVIGKKW